MPSHPTFQRQVVELASMFQWWHLHIRRSIGQGHKWVTTTNISGWPDLWLFRPDRGYVAAELKIPPDQVSPPQQKVLEFLARMPSTVTKIWTPNDWNDIRDVLAVKAPERYPSAPIGRRT